MNDKDGLYYVLSWFVLTAMVAVGSCFLEIVFYLRRKGGAAAPSQRNRMTALLLFLGTLLVLSVAIVAAPEFHYSVALARHDNGDWPEAWHIWFLRCILFCLLSLAPVVNLILAVCYISIFRSNCSQAFQWRVWNATIGYHLPFCLFILLLVVVEGPSAFIRELGLMMHDALSMSITLSWLWSFVAAAGAGYAYWKTFQTERCNDEN